MIRDPDSHLQFELTPGEEKQMALGYLTEAWIEAVRDGIDPAQVAKASVEAGVKELVALWGEGTTARHISQLLPRIEIGEFTDKGCRQ